jgi:hypothetical protein
VALFHASTSSYVKKVYPDKKDLNGDSDDSFLGMATVDVSSILTGKAVTIDKWLSLSGGSGTVRVVCEYEASDPSPRRGDIVKFTRFCNPADLYPVVPHKSYRVQDTDGEHMVLSYETPEGWICTFMAHRFMLICEERHHGAVEYYQDELAAITERLSQSQVVHEVRKNIDRVPEEGLLFVGVNAIQGGASLVERWWKGGLSTAVDDIVRTTNWDGQHQVVDDDEQQNESESETETSKPPAQLKDDDDYDYQPAAIPGMPCCPITGEPMHDPVVAADGHTYERSAIARWLQTSDKSPLTGAFLPHKELVPNYMLLSSLAEAAKVQDEE